MSHIFVGSSYFIVNIVFTILLLFVLYRRIGSKYFIPCFIMWAIFIIVASRINLLPLDFILTLDFSVSLKNIPHLIYFLKYFFALIFILLLGAFTFTIFLKGKDTLGITNLPVMWGLGTGVLSWVLILLGTWFNNFYFSQFVFIQIPLTVFFLYFLGNRLKLKGIVSGKKSFLLVSILIPFFITSLLHVVFYPELYWDSLIYGINLARIYHNENRIPLIAGGPSLGIELSSNYPPAHQVLVSFLFFNSIEHPLFSRLFSFVTAIFIIILAYFWSKELFGKRFFSILTVMILVSLPLFILFSRYSIFYIYFLLQISLSLYFLYKFYIGKRNSDLFLSSLFAGFSLLSSYLGIFYIFFLAATFILGRMRNFKSLLICLIILGLVYSPWFFRNLIYLGNPFWPFGGGKYIDKTILTNTLTVQSRTSKVLGFNFETFADLKNSIYRLLFTYPNFYVGTLVNGFRPYFPLFVIPALLIALKKKDKKMLFFSTIVLTQLFLYTSFFNWFERYMIAITLPITFLSIYLIHCVEESRFIKYFLLILTFVFYLNSLVFSLNWDECFIYDKCDVLEIFRNLGNYNRILEICYHDAAKAWDWISSTFQNNEIIATDDIRHYYLKQKNLINLDSWTTKDIFYSDNLEDGLGIFCEKNISFLYLVNSAVILPQWLKEIHNSSKVTLVKNFNDIKIYKLNC